MENLCIMDNNNDVLFFEDRKPERLLSYATLLNLSGTGTAEPATSKKRGAVWHDSDDEDSTASAASAHEVSLNDVNILKKLQKIDDETSISGNGKERVVLKGPEFITRLREQ